MTSFREGPNPEIKSNASIVEKRNIWKWNVGFGKGNMIGHNQEKEDDKNVVASISNNNEVLVLSNEYLHVDEEWVEWIVDTVASYHATPHLELFFLL